MLLLSFSCDPAVDAEGNGALRWKCGQADAARQQGGPLKVWAAKKGCAAKRPQWAMFSVFLTNIQILGREAVNHQSALASFVATHTCCRPRFLPSRQLPSVTQVVIDGAAASSQKLLRTQRSDKALAILGSVGPEISWLCGR